MDNDDRGLVAASLAGDAAAFEAIVRRYHRPVYAIARRIVGDAEEAKDVSQAVFLKVYEGLAGFDPQRRLFSWIYRIATNEAINARARRRPTGPDAPEPEAPGAGPEEQAGLEQLGRALTEALAGISADHQAVVVLKHFEGCSYRDISDILELPEKTVKSRLYEARQLLRVALARWSEQ